MHQLIYKLIGTALLLFCATAAHTAGNHAHNDMTKAIIEYRELNANEQLMQDVLDTYGRAMEERSIDTMETAVIPGDFSTIESGYPNWTWEDFRDNHLAVEIESFADVDYQIDLIVGETQNQLGFAVFRYTASGSMQGQTISISGLGTAVLEQTKNKSVNNGWRIHHLHTSAPRNQLEQAAKAADQS